MGLGKIGHIKRDCQVTKKKMQAKEVNGAEKAHCVHTKKCGSEDCNNDADGLVMWQALSAGDTQSHHWIIDSGATCHMCNDETLFSDMISLKQPQTVTAGDGRQLKATGRETVVLDIEVSGGDRKCTLSDALYVPDLKSSLLSVAKASKAVKRTVFTDDGCEFIDGKGEVVAAGRKVGKLYFLDCKGVHSARLTTGTGSTQEQLWHRRYGHLGIKSLRELVDQNMVTELNSKITNNIDVFEPFAEGKQHRQKFPDGEVKHSDAALGLVHSDVCGPMSTQSLSGAQYFLTFTDDKTRYTWVYVLKRKGEVFDKFIKWKAMVELSTGVKLKSLRTDNGGEYTSTEFKAYLRQEGIRHELSVP